MFKRTTLCRSLAVAFGGAAALSSGQVLAQQAASDSSQRIEITGSNIRRTQAETAAPIQLITKDDIDQSGKGTVAEYLQTLTADSQGSVPFTYGRGFSGGTAAGISLRGLGANATLVLINGRRVTPAVLADDAQRSFSDLNAIPLEAVERVEVLKDGASSIYGSDAVAGVVNIILKKNFNGITGKASYGQSRYSDGKEGRVAITGGFGDLDKDGFNLLLDAEASKKDPIWYRDRVGRGTVGISAIGNPAYGFGFNPNGTSNNLARTGGNGWIPTAATATGRTNNSITQSIIGSVRNPYANGVTGSLDYFSRGDASAATGFTRTFPAAQTFCNANANLPQNNPAGGCVTDIWQQVGQVQPEQKTYNLFSRLTKRLGGDLEAFAEVSYYHTQSNVVTTGTTPSTAVNTPSGVPISQTAVTLLGANHPDNPYFGTAARLSYNPSLEPGVGPTVNDSSSHTGRVVAGVQGTLASWDFRSGVFFSEAQQTDTLHNRINYVVKNALLNPTAANVAAATAASPTYAALPAGTYWRIGENAGLNSAAVYDALLDDLSRKGFSRQYGVDFNVSSEIGTLPGGPIGFAVGGEFRREANNLPFYDGLGQYIGLSLTKYGGSRNIYALYTEGLFPVVKMVELTAALRYDHYSDAGGAVSPKVGLKVTPLPTLALRGTVARGFRAPSSPENNINSVAAFSGATVNDPLRCKGTGVDASLCNGVAPTYVQRGNPALESEKSTSGTLGLVWDITQKMSLTADLWQIKRTGLPVVENTQAAIDAGNYIRDPATATTPTDPGGILVAFVKFVNAAQSLTRGIDLDFKSRYDLGTGFGKLTGGASWTHLLTQRVIDPDGTRHDYAGTHGNCEITNCMGSPKDRVSLNATWDMGMWRTGANVNYRGSFDGIDEKGAPCWSAAIAIGGASIPSDCKIKSFTTLDVSGAFKIAKSIEIFGSIQNLTDRKPPFDPETYGALGYNPLDYSGAIGRFFRIGVRGSF